MARKLVPLEEAARQLGVSPEKLNEMRERQEIYGYRDGASWKFKPEDVERLAVERAARGSGVRLTDSGSLPVTAGDSDDDGDDIVLLSEVELGSSGSSPSSTVIGKPGVFPPASQSDLKLAGSSVTRKAAGGSGVKRTSGEDVLPLELDDDLPIDLGAGSGAGESPAIDLSVGSGVSLAGDDSPGARDPGSESTIQLSEPGPGSDNVLAGGPGSDVTLSPGDSGISLVDPADSGLSLEQPLELTPATESSFDLTTDSSQLLAESSQFDSDLVMEVKPDDEFLLTPLDESTDEESQDSGSQVIALDAGSSFEDASATMVAGEEEASSALLEPDDSAAAHPLEAAFGPAGSALAGAAPAMMLAPAREAQYSVWQIVGLSGCVVVLSFTGMMMFDLMRNMWSWDSAYSANSFLMDKILGIFEN